MGPQIHLPTEGESKIDLFQRREIRKTLHDNEWWFCVKDVVEAVTGASDETRYIADIRQRSGLDQRYSEITRALPFRSPGVLRRRHLLTSRAYSVSCSPCRV